MKRPLPWSARHFKKALVPPRWPFPLAIAGAILTGNATAAPINGALNRIVVPDVNLLGVLDKTGPNAAQWPQITQPGPAPAAGQPRPNQIKLQQLGKALFYDMQVGGDGIQACASCHYHAGADHRKTNQVSPGLKAGDTVHDLPVGPNGTLTTAHFGFLDQASPAGPVGLPVSEPALIGAGAVADDVNGNRPSPDPLVKVGNPNLDVNDVVSSQGIRLGTFFGLTPDPLPPLFGRADTATLANSDPGFNFAFTTNGPGIPDTVRRVEPRNSPTVLNAVYNFRNFWDGRGDAFFNGVNPLGFRDPDARVKVFQSGTLGEERLRVPFSSLASQAVGPVLSAFEMHFDPRSFAQVGKKLANTQPLKGQAVANNDSLLTAAFNNLRSGSGLGLNVTYDTLIKQVFDQRFWGNGTGADVCLEVTGSTVSLLGGNGTCPADPGDLANNQFTLLQYNFALFFGLAVQAYEATLFTGETIVDLIEGGIATGTITNGRRVVSVGPPAGSAPGTPGLTLQDCIAAVALNNSAAQQTVATNLCTAHFAKFIHPGAVSGAESLIATNGAVGPDQAIGGCANPLACASSPNLVRARPILLAIERGLNRFFAGATGCGICHFNPEFTGATVSALTGFGAAPPLPLPPGQLRKIPPEVPMERMIAFNGAAAVYDSGFYNLGIRPTPEDLSIGDQIGGVPLAFTKLAEVIAGGNATGYDAAKISRIADELFAGVMRLPTAPANLTPVPWNLQLACGPGLNGNGNGGGEPNNNPNARCVPNVVPGERLLSNGAFKASGLRNVKFTGPYFHNGAKMSVRQVVETYQSAGHFTTLNFNNLDAGLRIFALGPADEAALVEMMETGLTDWRVAYEQGKFDHPGLCIPNGHDPVTGKTILAGIPAVGATGSTRRLQTFEEQLRGITTNRSHTLADPCAIPGISVAGLSVIDVPPAPAP